MKRITFPIIVTLFSLACQFLLPAARDGAVISSCAEIVAAVRTLQPGAAPQHLLDGEVKNGEEFDANRYFTVLDHVSMREGYVLDYVYISESLGGSPFLYARPENQAPYAFMDEIPANASDIREYIEVEDVAQGYFEYVVLNTMANQFYLDWHALYNDREIVCNRADVNEIVAEVSDGSFGNPLDLPGQVKARAMKNIEPTVVLTGDHAVVEVITFTKWGGFYRQRYTISRSFPHPMIDSESENIVPYDCGITF